MESITEQINDILGRIRYENAEGIHTYHSCRCGNATRAGECAKCLEQRLDVLRARRDCYVTGSRGEIIHPFDLQDHEISIEHIACSLSNLCRFNGLLLPGQFYSVAEHSVLMSHYVPTEHALAALLHDAPEAYFGDLMAPIKRLLPDVQELEASIWRRLAAHFILPEELPEEVKELDRLMVPTEAVRLKGFSGKSLEELYGAPPISYITMRIEGWTPSHAYRCFMSRYLYLTQ